MTEELDGSVTEEAKDAELTESAAPETDEDEREGLEDADAADEETETEPEEEPQKPVGRAQARIQRQAAELKAERAEKERLIAERAVAHAELESYKRQQQAAQSGAERRAQEEQLALLDPQERALFHANEQLRKMEQRLNQMETQRFDDQDRASFHARAAHDETYGKYVDKVEKMYKEVVARGGYSSREDIHSYILGQELKKDMDAKISQKKVSASKRVESVTSKPASARGDVSGSKKGKSEEDRLRGVLF